MEMAKVTSKGQITIPVSIRRRLKINEGDKILFIDTQDGVVMVNPDMLPGSSYSGNSTGKPTGRSRSKSTGKSDPRIRDSEIIESVEAAIAEDQEVSPDTIAEPITVEEAEIVDNTMGSEVQDPELEEVTSQAGLAGDSVSDVDTLLEATAPVKETEKPSSLVQGFDLSALLDEIRSIGSQI